VEQPGRVWGQGFIDGAAVQNQSWIPFERTKWDPLTIREERVLPIQILNRTIYEVPSSLLNHNHWIIVLSYISRESNLNSHVSCLTHYSFWIVSFRSSDYLRLILNDLLTFVKVIMSNIGLKILATSVLMFHLFHNTWHSWLYYVYQCIILNLNILNNI